MKKNAFTLSIIILFGISVYTVISYNKNKTTGSNTSVSNSILSVKDSKNSINKKSVLLVELKCLT